MVEQTHSTLRFASRAKFIKNKPVVNEVLSDAALLKRMSKEIKKLKMDLEIERNEKKDTDVVQEVKNKLEMEQQMNFDLKTKIRLLNEKLVTSSTCRTPKPFAKKSNSKRRETWAAPAMVGRRTMLPINFAALNANLIGPKRFQSPPKKSLLSVVSENPSVSDDASFMTAYDGDLTMTNKTARVSESSTESNDPFESVNSCKKITSRRQRCVSFAMSGETSKDNFAPSDFVSKRKKRGSGRESCESSSSVFLSDAPLVTVGEVVDAQCQTDDSLMPKLK